MSDINKVEAHRVLLDGARGAAGPTAREVLLVCLEKMTQERIYTEDPDLRLKVMEGRLNSIVATMRGYGFTLNDAVEEQR